MLVFCERLIMSQDEKHPFRDDEKHPFGNDKKKFESEDALNSAPADQPPSYDDVVNEDMKYQQQQQQQQQQNINNNIPTPEYPSNTIPSRSNYQHRPHSGGNTGYPGTRTTTYGSANLRKGI